MFYTITGIQIDLTRLEQLLGRAVDLTPVFISGFQPLTTEFLKKQFDSEGAHGGSKWAALSPATLKARMEPGHGRGGIGRDTNRMWGSLTKSAGAMAGPDGYLKITPKVYERGTQLTYAEWFVKGRKGSLQPARPIFPNPMPPQYIEEANHLVELFIAYGQVPT